ncbi:MAG: Methyltransferase type 11 [Anaerocolumna sp.]|jgi:ubiquinone/menaquinone biosynthesis C-methylase UbiE|nr:Methyltransferase type 11 [Anaerocolumna sp.]
MNEQLLKYLQKRPKVYEPSTAKFWDDEHISKGMLEAHLNPNWDAATRNHEFVEKSVAWLKECVNPKAYANLLDIGCGPGIYAEKFYQSGYKVTGMDFSKRSIDYAIESANSKNFDIRYIYQNYLEMDFQNEYDIITLIYCDFGALSTMDRQKLLNNVYKALKPNGTFVVDVFSTNFNQSKKEEQSWSYHDGGYWSEKPHACFESFYRYDDDNTLLDQYIVLTNDDTNCYNIWNHLFTTDELIKDFSDAGFSDIQFFGDVTGNNYSENGDVICVKAKK